MDENTRIITIKILDTIELFQKFTFITFRTTGTWGIGSSTDNGEYLSEFIYSKIVDFEKIYLMILDFTNLDYVHGNSIFSFVIHLLKRQVKFKYCIIANGKTKVALESLYKESKMNFNFLGIFNNIESGKIELGKEEIA
jgi:hypothetical protein